MKINKLSIFKKKNYGKIWGIQKYEKFDFFMWLFNGF